MDTGSASSQLTKDDQHLFLLMPEQRRVLVVSEEGDTIGEWACDKSNKTPVTISAMKRNHDGHKYDDDVLIIGDATENSNALYLYRKDGTLKSAIPLPSGCLVDGLDNVCIDEDNHVLVCNFSTPEIIKINLSDGEQMKTFRTTSRRESNQLAITATPEGYVVVSEKGRINVYELKSELCEVNMMLTNDHIYTSLSSAADGCVVGLDVKLKQLTKYGYLHFNTFP